MTDKTPKAFQTAKLSKDGKWRWFPKVPHLVQYVPNGRYYGRKKHLGKIHKKSLNTDVFSVAKERLNDFISDLYQTQTDGGSLTFGQALVIYRHATNQDVAAKANSKRYRSWCITKLLESWPGIEKKLLADITEKECLDWSSRLAKAISSTYYNNTLSTFKQIFQAGSEEQSKLGGDLLRDPSAKVKRVRVSSKELILPEHSKFSALVLEVRRNSGSHGPEAADMIEFLTYSGMRVFSEAKHFTWEDIDWSRKELVVRGDPSTSTSGQKIGTKNSESRRIPMNPDMEEFLQRLKAKRDKVRQKTSGKLFRISECQHSLTRACAALGIPNLTHHDLRHLFATRCIESGVDIPTVATWLGHKDRGVLAMKTYGHLRNEHSVSMAQKVRFNQPPAPVPSAG